MKLTFSAKKKADIKLIYTVSPHLTWSSIGSVTLSETTYIENNFIIGYIKVKFL